VSDSIVPVNLPGTISIPAAGERSWGKPAKMASNIHLNFICIIFYPCQVSVRSTEGGLRSGSSGQVVSGLPLTTCVRNPDLAGKHDLGREPAGAGPNDDGI